MINIEMNGVVGEHFTTGTVQSALREGGPLTVTLNSGGGYAAEGAAVYALLAAHPARVDVQIVGIAASAASLIAMAGQSITMRAGAVMMIHDPMNFTIGNSADHARTIEQLEAFAMAYARIYAARSGKSVAAAREIMKAETWYDGESAVAAGFATHVDKAPAAPFASYDYRKYSGAERAFAGARNERAGWKQAAMAAKQRADLQVRG